MRTAIAQYPSSCQECYASVKVGDSICQDGGRWIHEACMERSIEQARVMKVAQDVHRASKGMDEMQYSVSYSRGSAMNWALEDGIITQDEYDLVRKSRTYRLLWNYVAD